MNPRARRQEGAICMLMADLSTEIEKLKRISKDENLAAILADKSLKWVRSRCPPKHRARFFRAAGYVCGAARALNLSVTEFVGQLLDEDDNEDAEIIGAVAKYAKLWRESAK